MREKKKERERIKDGVTSHVLGKEKNLTCETFCPGLKIQWWTCWIDYHQVHCCHCRKRCHTAASASYLYWESHFESSWTFDSPKYLKLSKKKKKTPSFPNIALYKSPPSGFCVTSTAGSLADRAVIGCLAAGVCDSCWTSREAHNSAEQQLSPCSV